MEKVSGISVENVYVPDLWCYDETTFLIDVKDEVCNESNADIIYQSENVPSGSQATTSTSSTSIQSTSRKAKKKRYRKAKAAQLRVVAEKSFDLMQQIVNSAQPAPTKADLFCQMLSNELKGFKEEETYSKFIERAYKLLALSKIEENNKRKINENLNLYPSTSTPASQPSKLPQHSFLKTSSCTFSPINTCSITGTFLKKT